MRVDRTDGGAVDTELAEKPEPTIAEAVREQIGGPRGLIESAIPVTCYPLVQKRSSPGRFARWRLVLQHPLESFVRVGLPPLAQDLVQCARSGIVGRE